MKRKLQVTVVASALALGSAHLVISGVGGAASDGNRATYSGSAGPGFASESVSALTRPRTAADSIVAAQLGPAAANISDIRAARFAGVDGTQNIYVAPGTNGTICLVVIDTADQSATTDCADRTTLASGSVYISTPNLSTRTEDVIGIVGDGVPAVAGNSGSVATVSNNVFVLHGLRGQTLTLKNNVGSRSVVDLGAQFPPGS